MGFPSSFVPRRYRRRTSRAGPGHRSTDLELLDHIGLILQSGSSLVTCDRRRTVRGGSGSRFEIGFSGVASITQHRAVGMMLYALAEMSADPPLRRFVFTNWDDEGDARLELVALDINCRPLPL